MASEVPWLTDGTSLPCGAVQPLKAIAKGLTRNTAVICFPEKGQGQRAMQCTLLRTTLPSHKSQTEGRRNTVTFIKERSAPSTEQLMGQRGTSVPCSCSFGLLHSIPQHIGPAPLHMSFWKEVLGRLHYAFRAAIISEGSLAVPSTGLIRRKGR